MEERPLNLEINEDPTLVKFSEEEEKTFLKNCNDAAMAISYAKTLVKEKRLTEGMKDTMCCVIDHNVQDLCSALGYESKFKKDQAKTLKEIREVNIENRELRRQLGEKVSFEDLRERMKTVAECFKWWLDKYGFGYAFDVVFTDYGTLKCKMCTYIEPDEEGKVKIEKLKEYGFTFLTKSNDYPTLEISRNNIDLLHKYFLEYIPTFTIQTGEITCYGQVPLIMSVNLHIKTLDFIEKYMPEFLEYRKAEEERFLSK